jgi:hypothetical protein
LVNDACASALYLGMNDRVDEINKEYPKVQKM